MDPKAENRARRFYFLPQNLALLKSLFCKVLTRNSFAADPKGGNRPPRFYFPQNIKLQNISILLYFCMKLVRGGPEGGKSNP